MYKSEIKKYIYIYIKRERERFEYIQEVSHTRIYVNSKLKSVRLRRRRPSSARRKLKS